MGVDRARICTSSSKLYFHGDVVFPREGIDKG
uniref:Uncharacterized protein n=1 Tax=Arundo donax TaxID=35708 RepID=A0A0A9AAK5_ARUDO